MPLARIRLDLTIKPAEVSHHCSSWPWLGAGLLVSCGGCTAQSSRVTSLQVDTQLWSSQEIQASTGQASPLESGMSDIVHCVLFGLQNLQP